MTRKEIIEKLKVDLKRLQGSIALLDEDIVIESTIDSKIDAVIYFYPKNSSDQDIEPLETFHLTGE